MKFIIAGGSGRIGQALIRTLVAQNHHIVLLSRDPATSGFKSGHQIQVQEWDGVTLGPWKHQLTWADAVINLCGESVVDKPWNPKQKKILYDSRIIPTRTLVQAMANVEPRPKTLINASAIGYYGSVQKNEVIESYRRGPGFLAQLCESWELEAEKAESLGVRTIRIRTGIVLEKEGGALAKMLPIFRLGLGGPLGNGRQFMSWIHQEDLVSVILFALKSQNLQGAVNAVSPYPVTMKEFSGTLGKVLHRPAIFPVPKFVLDLILGERASILLEGQKAIPKKLTEAGFSFRFPKLEDALLDILKEPAA